MHELAIVEGVVDQVTERLPDAKISWVRLEIGALTGVVCDALRFSFELATEGTNLQGAALEITEIPDSQELKIAAVKVVA
jgi:hydrogenase nickel incorporation protein HypA/HybF